MNQKFYFYILKCSDNSQYYGHTNDLRDRLFRHSKGLVKSTESKRPIELVYYEDFDNRSEAYKREMMFKNGKTRKGTIRKLIDSFPMTKCQGFNSH